MNYLIEKQIYCNLFHKGVVQSPLWRLNPAWMKLAMFPLTPLMKVISASLFFFFFDLMISRTAQKGL